MNGLNFSKNFIDWLSSKLPLPKNFSMNFLLISSNVPICITLYTVGIYPSAEKKVTDIDKEEIELKFYFVLENIVATESCPNSGSDVLLPTGIAYYLINYFARFFLAFMPKTVSVVAGKIETFDLSMQPSKDIFEKTKESFKSSFDLNLWHFFKISFSPALTGCGFMSMFPDLKKANSRLSLINVTGQNAYRFQPFFETVTENPNIDYTRIGFAQLFVMKLINLPVIPINGSASFIQFFGELPKEFTTAMFQNLLQFNTVVASSDFKPVVSQIEPLETALFVKYSELIVQFNPWFLELQNLNVPLYDQVFVQYGINQVGLRLNPSFLAPGIYIIQNKKNQKFYIGETMCLAERLGNHYSDLLNGTFYSKEMQKDFENQGRNLNDFDFFILPFLEGFQGDGLRQIFEEDIKRYNPTLCYNAITSKGPVLTNCFGIPNFDFETYNSLENTLAIRIKGRDSTNLVNPNRDTEIKDRLFRRLAVLRAPNDKQFEFSPIFVGLYNQLSADTQKQLLSYLLIVYLVETILNVHALQQEKNRLKSENKSSRHLNINTRLWKWESQSYNFGRYSLRGFLLRGKKKGGDYGEDYTLSLTGPQFDALNPEELNFETILKYVNEFYSKNGLMVK
jgi:hypothetical protein